MRSNKKTITLNTDKHTNKLLGPLDLKDVYDVLDEM